LKRQRLERQRSAIKKQIDQLQALGSAEHSAEIDHLSEQLLSVAIRLDREVTGA
jgi:hypothetical protein